MALDRPVHAPETADGTTAPVVALHIPLASAVHGDLAQTPPDFWDTQTGSSNAYTYISEFDLPIFGGTSHRTGLAQTPPDFWASASRG